MYSFVLFLFVNYLMHTVCIQLYALYQYAYQADKDNLSVLHVYDTTYCVLYASCIPVISTEYYLYSNLYVLWAAVLALHTPGMRTSLTVPGTWYVRSHRYVHRPYEHTDDLSYANVSVFLLRNASIQCLGMPVCRLQFGFGVQCTTVSCVV